MKIGHKAVPLAIALALDGCSDGDDNPDGSSATTSAVGSSASASVVSDEAAIRRLFNQFKQAWAGGGRIAPVGR